MLQQVARVGRLGSKALPSPTLGIRASMINLPMILIEEYTLNPAVRSLAPSLLGSKVWDHNPRYYTIATKNVPFGATESPRYYTSATINVTFGAANRPRYYTIATNNLPLLESHSLKP